VHLVVGPMYHTMPNAYAAQHLFVGATVVIMPRFDAEECLGLVARERVTTSSMVPAHFIRILELAPEVRAAHDLSSVRKILHAAAPCPPEVKRRIMQVFPPDTVWEFYGASEGPGTIISPSEWLQRPGSVGRPWPGVTVKVLGDDGRELPAGEVGTIYLSTLGSRKFSYRNAPEKTAAAFRGDFFTVGDMGWLDDAAASTSIPPRSRPRCSRIPTSSTPRSSGFPTSAGVSPCARSSSRVAAPR